MTVLGSTSRYPLGAIRQSFGRLEPATVAPGLMREKCIDDPRSDFTTRCDEGPVHDQTIAHARLGCTPALVPVAGSHQPVSVYHRHVDRRRIICVELHHGRLALVSAIRCHAC